MPSGARRRDAAQRSSARCVRRAVGMERGRNCARRSVRAHSVNFRHGLTGLPCRCTACGVRMCSGLRSSAHLARSGRKPRSSSKRQGPFVVRPIGATAAGALPTHWRHPRGLKAVAPGPSKNVAASTARRASFAVVARVFIACLRPPCPTSNDFRVHCCARSVGRTLVFRGRRAPTAGRPTAAVGRGNPRNRRQPEVAISTVLLKTACMQSRTSVFTSRNLHQPPLFGANFRYTPGRVPQRPWDA